ncbi:hypothetical protein NI17_006035 [Thermobifida halotolerans]|uniref:Uncharacterized protein n=1 Tax=Thermobifida halotolerans TaxID=483545 RepID=A0A399G9G5_9ACTN|nr:hypothetical protein [Thermobifida halotolerans]UOE20756.1 hypothetical protein NI17_006035 [Thermobifida halotolerans]
MDETELRDALEAVRATDVPASDPRRTWEKHLKAAWLLIALRRYDDAVTEAEQAQSAYQRAHLPGRTTAVLWSACAAGAVAHLAAGRWAAAEDSAREALRDFGEDQTNYYLLELALQAQGRLEPNRIWKVSQDPARELAAFDARRFALSRLDRP